MSSSSDKDSEKLYSENISLPPGTYILKCLKCGGVDKRTGQYLQQVKDMKVHVEKCPGRRPRTKCTYLYSEGYTCDNTAEENRSRCMHH